MIVKILNKTSKTFSGVQYNDNKIGKGTGELMIMKNFPNHIMPSSSQGEVRDYLMSIKNDKVINKQFHCTLSTEKRDHSKEVLADMAERFMEKMGYGKQPYIVVFHNDTDNNHVHIVTTRIDKETKLGIDRDFEKLKSQTAMREILKEMYGVDHDKRIDKLLAYTYSNQGQLEKLLNNAGYETSVKDNALNIIHNGVPLKSINVDDIKYTDDRNEQRKKQIYSILNRFKNSYSNNVFQVVDQRNQNTAYVSELQKELRERLGLEIKFSYKDDKAPFGYIIIDNKTNTVFKGGDIMKMGNLFNFTPDKIDKAFFDILTNYNVSNKETKKALIAYLEPKYNLAVKDYMVFGSNTKVPYQIFDDTRSIAVSYIRNYEERRHLEDRVSFVEQDDKIYLINEKEHKIFDLQKLVGNRLYEQYLHEVNQPHSSLSLQQEQQTQIYSTTPTLEELLKLNSASDYSSGAIGEDEEERKKRKKKRR